MPDIRAATSDDLPAIGRTLASAFEDDPIWMYLVPDRARWRRGAPRYFAADAANRLRHGSVYVNADVTGAALWAPPDTWRPSMVDLAREMPTGMRLFGIRLPRALRVLTRMEKVHPAGPHHYLAVLGTDPTAQGKGIGSALVCHVTEQADREGLPCYLESSKEQNVPFYARHGFEVTSELSLHNGPPLWPMWREPRS
jgi:GNAT superfamily N-acetyltransferase